MLLDQRVVYFSFLFSCFFLLSNVWHFIYVHSPISKALFYRALDMVHCCTSCSFSTFELFQSDCWPLCGFSHKSPPCSYGRLWQMTFSRQFPSGLLYLPLDNWQFNQQCPPELAKCWTCPTFRLFMRGLLSLTCCGFANKPKCYLHL